MLVTTPVPINFCVPGMTERKPPSTIILCRLWFRGPRNVLQCGNRAELGSGQQGESGVDVPMLTCAPQVLHAIDPPVTAYFLLHFAAHDVVPCPNTSLHCILVSTRWRRTPMLFLSLRCEVHRPSVEVGLTHAFACQGRAPRANLSDTRMIFACVGVRSTS